VQTRVECSQRGCSSMVEQKLPKPRHINKRHYSCVFQAHEYAITPKLHFNQQVRCHHSFHPTLRGGKLMLQSRV
jgi:hypothetical protein